MRRRRPRPTESDPKRLIFLAHAQSDAGGYYRHQPDGRSVRFIRPLGAVMMRVRDLRTHEMLNVSYSDLRPLSEMEVIALQLLDAPDMEKTAPGQPEHERKEAPGHDPDGS